ncbi:MAG: hypothetical protein EXX96DRAFT_549317 [Benjaminiella poitrasii]|nr:MAG: hypothetical protein EXX96DRAFT_549317 [Benjaminiella poitrasii]
MSTSVEDNNNTILTTATTSLDAFGSTSLIPSTTTNLLPYPTAMPSVQSTGWNSNGNQQNVNHQSWLKEHNRFVFIIFVGLLILAILIWYLYRSIKGMRKRLEQENQEQLYMMQQASSHPYSPPPPTNATNTYTTNNSLIPELTQTPPPAYKTQENTPVTYSSPPTTEQNRY